MAQSVSRESIKLSEADKDKVNDVAVSLLNTSDGNHHEFDIERASLSSLKCISFGDLTKTKKSPSDCQVSILNRKASSLEGLSIRKVDPLNESSTRRSLSLNPLGGPSTRRVSSLDTLKESSRKVSSPNSLDGPSTKNVSFLDSLERTSTGRVSSVDPLERPSVRRVWSLNPLEGPSSRRVSSLDPLEGPSTRTVWFSDSAEDSSPRIDQSHNLETESNESLNSDPPTEQSRAWLSRFSRKIRQSKYYLLFHVVLLALPCSAGYMSSKYQTLCDGCSKLTFLVYILAILGMWIIIIRIAAILSKRYFAARLTGYELNNGLALIISAFFLCLFIEISTIFLCEPVFYPPCEEFCIKVFYNYAYYLNVTLLLVFLLLMLIHIPACFDPVEDE
ncbi:unnamed protein product [Larinioides sclopetarius]|uniref:Uncharacterized protein n=1 Tax=Larinioides sclopetarius TaxID=280406 RepID=A0AAV2BJ26_9ARAC